MQEPFAVSQNYYCEINLHIVWHTKNSLPLLTPTVEPIAYRALRKRIVDTPGVFLHQMGGIQTHVHVAVSIPPTLAPSEWIGQLKGGTTHDVNEQSPTRDKVLQWQAGYGIVSFGMKDLEWVVAYIENQREHHSHGRPVDRLERITHVDDVY